MEPQHVSHQQGPVQGVQNGELPTYSPVHPSAHPSIHPPTHPPDLAQSSVTPLSPPTGWALTTHVVAVGVVHFLHPAVAEGEFPHPVHAAMHTCTQAQAGPRCRAVETISGEVVCAGETGEG